MEEKFSQIKQEYDDFYKSMLKEGKLLAKDTGVGFWGPSVSDDVFETFKKLKLSKCKNFLDLGSGDGKVTLIASLFCQNATGVEFDPILTGKAHELKEKLAVHNARFVNDDFFNHEISGYDVIFHAPDKPLYRGVEEKLLNELKGDLVLFGHHFHPKQLHKKKSFTVNNTLVTVYTNQKP